MNDAYQPLPQLEIATPCPKSWQEMSGDDQSRFCSHCQKTVFNFTEMSSDEIRTTLKSDTRVCARLRRRSDGSILTADCREPRTINGRQWWSHLASLATMFLAMVTLVGCRNESESPDAGVEPTSTAATVEIMGDVCVVEMGEVTEDPKETGHDLMGRVVTPSTKHSE